METIKKITVAPKLRNCRHWIIYRINGVEVAFEISDNLKIIKKKQTITKKRNKVYQKTHNTKFYTK